MTSGFSLFVAIALFNLSLLVIAALRRSTRFLVRYSTGALLLMAVLAVLRMALPLDLVAAKVINSYVYLPKVISVLRTPIFNGAESVTPHLLIALVWVCGSVFVAAKAVLTFRRAKKLQKHWRTFACPDADVQLRGLGEPRAQVVTSPDIQVPMVTGFFRAKIYLPTLELDARETELILRHELQHFRQRDIWIKLFYYALAAVFWWNPLVHRFRRELDHLLELRCDIALMRRMSEQQRIRYLEVILKVAQHISSTAKREAPLTAALVAEKPEALLMQRFNVVLSKPPARARLYQSLATAVAVLVFVASFFIVIQPAYQHPDVEESLPLFRISPDNAYIVLKDGVYKVYVDGVYFADTTPEEIEIEFANFEIIVEE